MKQRIITGVIAAALFIPFVLYGNMPFSVLVCVIAAVGFYEILRMKDIALISVPGLLGLLAMLMLVVPDAWAEAFLQLVGYDSRLTVLYGLVALLLIYTVLVKNKMTYDEVSRLDALLDKLK